LLFDVYWAFLISWLMVVFAVYAIGFSVASFGFSRVFGLRAIVKNKVFLFANWCGVAVTMAFVASAWLWDLWASKDFFVLYYYFLGKSN